MRRLALTAALFAHTALPAQRPTSDLWSLQPLAETAPPAREKSRAEWARQPLDQCAAARLAAAGLEPSPEADRRTLIRRLSVDLTGLLPTPESVDAFVTDPDPNAYEQLVERLLASPGYAERQARHWLDVVHYADTHGYDKDKPRRNAWPYRDWVIDAIDRDLPWADFVTAQIAGDVVDGPAHSVAATGMLVAGPWDYVGHVELREGTVDKEITRNLDRDDVVTNVFGAFQSLTVHCARCHDHKFDPVPQRDYYALQAVFAGIERAERSYEPDPGIDAARQRAKANVDALRAEIAGFETQLDEAFAQSDDPAHVALRAEASSLRDLPDPPHDQRLGWHSAIVGTPSEEKWVELDLGAEQVIDAVVVYPSHEVFGGHPGPGFGLPRSLGVAWAGDDGTFGTEESWSQRDAGPRHGDEPIRFRFAAGTRARRVRIRSSDLFERTRDYCFALAEVEVLAGGQNVARDAAVTARDSIEAGELWGARFLVDGVRPWTDERARARRHAARVADARRTLAQELGISTLRDAATQRLAAAEAHLASLPPPGRVYAACREFPGEGAFRPAPGGQPRRIALLDRGEVTSPRDEVRPGALSVLGHAPADFVLDDDASEGARRLALAAWITHVDNPLTWRSAVNRVWQSHFGRGLVATPNDFGHMGAAPTHPDLLDHLARIFRDGGGSLRDLHRTIVLSATYRQSSADRPDAAALDASNQLLWRAPLRRLEAEAIRDSILRASGSLDRTQGGPGFELFAFEDDHSPRYRYELADPDDARTFRRSIYRFVVRSVPDPFMTVFDCADPSIPTPVRLETTTPLQALSLLHDRFVLAQAERMAARITADGGDPIDRAIALAWQRKPTAEERKLLLSHAEEHGLAAVCRVLFNSSEFLHVD
ncbi:MAG: DUF1553 domain-containing protein [Planctomycetota bacterium]